MAIIVAGHSQPAYAVDHLSWLFGTACPNGWIVSNATSSCVGGSLHIQPTTSDPQALSPSNLGFVPTTHDYIRCNIRSSSSNNQFQIYYKNSAHGFSESYSKIYTITNDGAYHYYTIPLSSDYTGNSQLASVPGWGPGGGNVTQLRLDPARASGGAIDYSFVVVRQDNSPPYPPVIGESPGSWTNGTITVTLQGDDPPPVSGSGNNPDLFGSGVYDFGWTVDGGSETWQVESDFDPIAGTAHLTLTFPPGSLATGAHSLSVRSRDRCGQIGISTEATLYYDGSPPGQPSVTSVSPNGWANQGGFAFAWTNPGDAGSGVASYQYEVDGGAPQSVGNVTSVSGITVGSGAHSFEVRAVDGVGNVGSWSSPAYFYFDNQPPNPPASVAVSPSGYSTQDNFAFSWPAGSDAVSGVAGYAYSVDGAGASFTTATSVSGALAAGREGTHTFQVATVDSAGNVSSSRASVTFYYFPRWVFPPLALAPAGGQAALPSTFSWNATGPGHTYYVEVAPDLSFSAGTSTFYTDVPWFMVPAFAAPDTGRTYYWRVMTTQSYPENWSAAATFAPYIPPPPPVSQVIGQEFPSGEAGEGVNTSLGAVTRGFTILMLRGPGGEIPLNAWYSSLSQRNSLIGSRWNWTLGQLLTPGGGGATVTLEDNQDLGFTQNGASFTSALGVYDSLASSGGGYVLVRPSRTRLSFDNLGTLQQITDRNGNTITLHYSGGVLTSFDDQAGRSYTVTLSNSRLTQIRDVTGRTWSFEYDGAGYLSAFTDARGSKTSFQYDGQGRLTKVIDPRQNTAVQYTYDGTGRVATQIDAYNNQTAFTYDDTNRRTTVTDPLGKSKVHVYDVNFRLAQDIDENGNTTTYGYDANHNRISTTDALNHTTINTYDPRGNVYLHVDAAGDSTRTVYDYQNQPVYRLQPSGKTTVWQNDAAGNPTEIDQRVQAGGALDWHTAFTYNAAEQVLTTTDANNHATTHVYDGQGNRTKTTDGSGVMTTFGYDAVGRQTSVTDGLSNTTAFRYDLDDSLLAHTDALQDSTTYEYDANGNRTAVVDPRGFRTEYAFDAKNRLTQAKDALGDVTQHSYDAVDRKVQTTDPRGGVTSFRYDPVGNLLSERDAIGDSTTHTYDAVDNRLSTTSPRGKTTTFAYDALNRLVRTTDPLGHFTVNAYDSLGRLVSVTNPRGNTAAYTYDLLDRLIAVQAPTGHQLQYRYDLVGNRTTTTNANEHATGMTYDGANRLLTVRDPLGNTQTYAYDEVGRRKSRTDGRGRVTNYSYDAADRLIQTAYDDNTTIVRGYNASGNLLSLTDQWGSDSYAYDRLNRLATSTDHYGNALAFTYDSTGNLVTITYPAGERCHYSFDPVNRLTGVTDWNGRTVGYGYDADGNTTRITYPNGVATTQTYDDAEHLLEILTLTPSSDTLVSFAYTLDENGNRTRIARVDKREDPVRGGGNDVYATSAALSSAAFLAGADSVVLAAGEDWTEAVNAPVLARRIGAPVLVIPGDNLWASSAIQSELARLKGQRPSPGAVVLGDIGGVSAVVEAQLGQEGFSPRRIRGADRFGTAGQAAAASPYAVLLGSTDAARAGGAALLAARLQAPLLFTERDSLPVATRTALAVAGVTRAILLGDLSTISQGVEDWLNANGHPVWKRHTGDASGMSVAALEDTVQTPDRFAQLQVADRNLYQDAVSAAGSSNPWTTATLLAGPDSVRNSSDIIRWLGRHKGWIQHTTLLGPASALSDNAAAEVRNLLRTTVNEYSYSPLDELTSEIIPGSDTTLYSYDAMGNRSSVTHNGVITSYTYDGSDRLASAGSATYTYDGNGNRITRSQGSTTTTYAFDYENRLTQISGPEGVSTYHYDGLGRRIRSEEPGRTARYVLDPMAKPYRTLRETDDVGATHMSYIHGDGLVSDVSLAGVTRYYHFDGLGSTAAITDSAGNDAGHLGFTAFGDTAEALGSPATRLGYVGRYGVEATASGLQFMRGRFYDPQAGAFLSTDPAAPDYQAYLDLSLYLYASSNPGNLIDPAGDWSLNPVKLVKSGRNAIKAVAKATAKAVTSTVNFFQARGPSSAVSNSAQGLASKAAEKALTKTASQSVAEMGAHVFSGALAGGVEIYQDTRKNSEVKSDYIPLRATLATEESVALDATGIGFFAGTAASVGLDVANKYVGFPITDFTTKYAITPLARTLVNPWLDPLVSTFKWY